MNELDATGISARRCKWHGCESMNAVFTGAQLAIWDILEDNGDGFSSGKIKSTAQTNSQVLASATNYEAISAPNGLPMMGTTLAYIYDNTDATTGAEVQDLIGQTPEPAAIILIFSGLALIGLGRLRRRVTR